MSSNKESSQTTKFHCLFLHLSEKVRLKIFRNQQTTPSAQKPLMIDYERSCSRLFMHIKLIFTELLTD